MQSHELNDDDIANLTTKLLRQDNMRPNFESELDFVDLSDRTKHVGQTVDILIEELEKAGTRTHYNQFTYSTLECRLLSSILECVTPCSDYAQLLSVSYLGRIFKPNAS